MSGSPMNDKAPRPVVMLRQGRESAVRRRHPWIFSGAVAERRGTLQRGCLVDVRSKDGAFLGCGHWGTKGIAVRLLSFESVEDEVALVHSKIANAASLRQRLGLVGNPLTTGFRLIHAEGDELPGLVIDLYADTAVVQCHSVGMWRLKDAIQESLLAIKELAISKVVFRRVESQIDEPEQAQEGEPTVAEQSQVVSFSENGLRFIADITGGQKTGFFLDQRVNRQKIKELAAGKHVLNAFCYTGAFSVYALAGGAQSVCSVDASKSAIDLCRQNVVANFASAPHHAEVADCFSYFAQTPDTFDLVVLDPPAFAKHQRAVQRAMRGYEAINALAIKKIKPGGILATFSCSQLVSRDMFRDAITRAALASGRFVRIVDLLHQAPCHPTSIFHPEGDYLKGFILFVE